MTDKERQVMRKIGARLAAGEKLTPEEFDEYLNLSALGVPAVAAR